jgi:choline dehydrogenase
VNLSAVGDDMVDNPINAIVVVSPQALETSLLSVAGIAAEGVVIEGASGGNWTWQWPGMGQLNVLPPLERTAAAVSRVQSSLQALPTATKAQIDQSGFILSKVYDPLSHGTLYLNSKDASQSPSVTFNYYTHPRDVQTCIMGVAYLRKLLRAPAFRQFRYTTVTPIMALLYPKLSSSQGDPTDGAYLPDLHNRTDVAKWCRATVTTIWHFHGGCVLGKVVDKDYKVFGARSLRVVDGSTFTKSPGTNPQATVMMLGR